MPSRSTIWTKSGLNYVGLRPHALSAITMPSKTQAGLAAGRALLVAAPGDVANVIRDSETGFIADPDSPGSVADAIRRACECGRGGLSELGARARIYYEQTFSVNHGLQRLESLLKDAAGRVGAPE